MPAEKFYLSGQVEGDGLPPDFTVSWGTDHDGGSSVKITQNAITFDTDDVTTDVTTVEYQLATPDDIKGLSRMLTALTRARNHMVQNRDPRKVHLPDMLLPDRTRLRKAPEFPFGPGGIISDDVEEWLSAAPLDTVVSPRIYPDGSSGPFVGNLYKLVRLADPKRAGLFWQQARDDTVFLTHAELADLAPLDVTEVPGKA